MLKEHDQNVNVYEEPCVSIDMDYVELSNNRKKDDCDSPDSPNHEDEEDILQDVELEIEDDKTTKKNPNTYAAKKTVAQGMMDIALITANANQLRYLIEFNRKSSTFYFNTALIAISLLLQVAVGMSLIFKGRLDLKGMSKERNAKMINNYVVVGVFLVTIINVFVASFTVTGVSHANEKA